MADTDPKDLGEFIFDRKRWDRLAGEQPDDEEALTVESTPDASRLMTATDTEQEDDGDA